MMTLNKEILKLKNNPIEIYKCIYFDKEKIKEYSEIEKEILFIENTINDLIKNLVKLKENFITSLLLRKDFFDTEKKNNKLLNLLITNTTDFNSELNNGNFFKLV